MKFLLAAILPEIWSETTLMCDFGFRCEDILCTTEICEYNWLLEERHSMSWRSGIIFFSRKKAKNSNEFFIKKNTLKNLSFDI